MLDYYRFKDIDDLFGMGRHEEARHLLMEMQASYISVCEENSTLRMQVHEFEDILYLARNLVFDGACYWLITGGIKQGPFCPHCYNRGGILIRLDFEEGLWRCVSCGATQDHECSPSARPPAESGGKPAKVIPFSVSG
jgi:hypothetical protein